MRRAGGLLMATALAGCVAPAGRERPARSVAPPERRSAPRPAATPIVPGHVELAGMPEQGALIAGRLAPGFVTLTLDGQPVPTAPDGRFLLGFDRDAPAIARLEARRSDGSGVVEAVAVRPHAWRIERLPTLPKHAQPEPEFLRLRTPELAQIAAARARTTDAAGWRQRFAWPVHGRQTGWFGSQRVYAGEPGEYHSGADVAVPVGTPVMAPADGVVVLAADHPFTLEGNLLLIDHGMGVTTALLHLSRILVRPGEHVVRGQVVARSGMTGRATGPHLHWGLRWRTARVDPLLVAGPVPLR